MRIRTVLASTLLLPALAFGACSDRTPTRQEVVATRGAAVMPFDLNKTHHIFEQSADGGMESVVVLDAADTAQIELIRAHLAHEATRFAAGDFSDPTAIHGTAMPGVAALSAAGARLTIAYADLPAGARITYASEDRAVIGAIHDWFNAQVTDHGQHASMH